MPTDAPEIHEGRDGPRIWIKRINWLLRHLGGFAVSDTGVVQVTAGVLSTLPLVPGEALFGGADFKIAQDPLFFWNNTAKRLGIGTASPLYRLHLEHTTALDILAFILNTSASPTAQSKIKISVGSDSSKYLDVGVLGANFPHAGNLNAAVAFLEASGDSPWMLLSALNGDIRFSTGGPRTERFQIKLNSDVLVGVSNASTDTNGFLFQSACAGVPTGVPTQYAATTLVPFRLDSNTGIYYYYDYAGVAWKPIVGAGGGGTVTAVTGTSPIVITGGASPTPNVTIIDFVASGASHAPGRVPDPGAVAGTTKFLREDATWAVPPDTDTGITQLTSDVTAGPGSGSQAATVVAIHETSGPTQLVIGAIATGEYLKRVGGALVSSVPTGDHKIMITSADTTPDYAQAKLLGTAGDITITKNNAGANENLQWDLPDHGSPATYGGATKYIEEIVTEVKGRVTFVQERTAPWALGTYVFTASHYSSVNALYSDTFWLAPASADEQQDSDDVNENGWPFIANIDASHYDFWVTVHTPDAASVDSGVWTWTFELFSDTTTTGKTAVIRSDAVARQMVGSSGALAFLSGKNVGVKVTGAQESGTSTTGVLRAFVTVVLKS